MQDFFGNDVFGPLSRFLLRPAKDIQEEIDSFKEKYFNQSVVGLQIRRVGAQKLNDLQEEILWECAENISSPDVKWFLATDNYATREYGIQLPSPCPDPRQQSRNTATK